MEDSKVYYNWIAILFKKSYKDNTRIYTLQL